MVLSRELALDWVGLLSQCGVIKGDALTERNSLNRNWDKAFAKTL